MLPRSGDSFTLRSGRYEAEVASVGASLRSLRADDVDLIVPFGADELRPSMRGAVLAPWPNRTANGTFEFGGMTHRLPITEPERGNAAHGLVSWLRFRPTSVDRASLSLTASIEPQPGYPWRVRIDVAFRVTEDGLSQEITATNEATEPAPVGLGGHPYLVAGAPGRRRIDDLVLTVAAEEILLVTPDRLLPERSAAVGSQPGLDFRKARRIDAAEINHAYTRLLRSGGLATASLVDGSGRGVEIAWDERCPWVQVYTSDHGGPEEFRGGVAVEPMTCPPDALNSRRDLAVLPPGASIGAGWTIRAIPRRAAQPL